MRMRMLPILAAVAAMLVLSVADADAQSRRTRKAGNTAMGAAAGALVGGPIGLIAGGAIGYTAGEGIARGLGIKKRHYRRASNARHRRR